MFDFEKTLSQYVAMPSISAQPAFKADCKKTASWVLELLGSMGFKGKLMPTGGHPLVLATREPQGASKSASSKSAKKSAAPSASKVSKSATPQKVARCASMASTAPVHVAIYGHYDVQPPEPLDLWKTEPFTLTKKGTKLFARGAADNKGPTLALLAGLSEALEANPELPVKISVMIEGEEEMGSANFYKVLPKIKKALGPIDAVILSDTDSHGPKDLVITTGIRGVMSLDVKVKALARDLHSGSGGPVPNAVRELTRVMGTMYRPDGMVNIPSFYKGIIKPNKVQLSSIKKSFSKTAFAKEIGAKGYYSMKGMCPYVASCFLPSLEFNGVYGGYQGEGSKTIIPAEATVKITCRVAPGQDPKVLLNGVTNAFKTRLNKRLFDFSIDVLEAGAPAYAAPLPHLDPAAKTQSPRFISAFQAMDKACLSVTKKKPSYLPMGGSIPIIGAISHQLGADAIMLGLFQTDSFLHSPNENVPLALLKNGVKVWRNFFSNLAG